MPPECPFCRVASGAAPAAIVGAFPDAVAFLDHRPLFPGHTLVIPREHLETLTDLPADRVAGFWSAVQRVARAVETACGAQGTFVAVNNRVSQSVPHLHAHVVPRTKGDGLKGFFWPRRKYANDEQRDAVAEAIRAELERTAER